MLDLLESSLWKHKVSNVSQLGGIEVAVLANGPGRGVRIAWVNTGSGLRYKVVLDRGCDIADAFYNEHSLAWISHGGISSPNPAAYQGAEWLRSFGGGLMTTCGLSHVGGPEETGDVKKGLHDRLSNLPAEVVSIVQPDLQWGDVEMSISVVIRQTSVLGEHFVLKRKISSQLGCDFIDVKDEVLNAGNEAIDHMLLYHINVGWPLLDAGATFHYNGAAKVLKMAPGYPLDDLRQVPDVIAAHNGSGENVIAVDVQPDADGICTGGLFNPKLKLGLLLKYKKEQLPWLINWQHFGRNEYVAGLEPATHPPIGQQAARQNGTLICLAPGEVRCYQLRIEIISKP